MLIVFWAGNSMRNSKLISRLFIEGGDDVSGDGAFEGGKDVSSDGTFDGS